MAVSMNVRADFKRVQRWMDGVEKKAVTKAAIRSLNDTATTVRAQAARDLKAQGGFSRVGDVKKRITIRKATRHVLAATLTATGRASNLINFGARQVKTGVSHKAWNRRQTATGAFIANQGRTVFARTSANRLPIKALWGPSIPNEFEREPMPTKIRKLAQKTWPKKFKQRLQYEINRVRK